MLGIYVVIDKLLLNDRRVSKRRDMCLHTGRPTSIKISFSVLRQSMRPQYRITPCYTPHEVRLHSFQRISSVTLRMIIRL